MAKLLVHIERPSALLIQESKIADKDLDRIKNKIWSQSMVASCQALGQSGGLIVLWDNSQVECMPISISNSWMVLSARCTTTGNQFGILNIYGHEPNDEKRDIWNQLDHWFSSHSNTPWILGGYFNAIRNLLEKEGGSTQLDSSTNDFNSFIYEQQLYEPPCINGLYTWTNKKKDEQAILEKLDRFLVTMYWLEQENIMQTEVLPYGGSDHWPVALTWATPTKPKATPFRFQKCGLITPHLIT